MNAAPLVIADDLSGAAEAAAAFGPGTTVLIEPDPATTVPDGPVVLDLETRGAGPDEAARRTRDALRLTTRPVTVKKIDSQLRGEVAAELAALRSDRPVVVAPALPALARTVRDGVVHLDGVPLHQTGAWRVEPKPPPRSVAEAVGVADARLVTLAEVRGDLDAALASAPVVVCDAETEADLARIAAVGLRHGALLVGSAALCQAVTGLASPPPRSPTATVAPGQRCLVVSGTAELVAREQVSRLVAATGAARVLVPSEPGRDAETAARLAAALEHGDAVVQLEPFVSASARLAPRLAGIVETALADRPPVDLVLLGGTTAYEVLSRLGTRRLVVEAEIHPGAVASRCSRGRAVTRPGSFGGPDSLLTIHQYLRPTEGAS